MKFFMKNMMVCAIDLFLVSTFVHKYNRIYKCIIEHLIILKRLLVKDRHQFN